MEIPIRNIYYLLCYAWDMLDEGKRSELGADDYDEAINLISRVLLNGLSHLFKRGLDRDYINEVVEYPGIKGKIIFSDSIKRDSFRHGKAICSFDQFEYNVLHNQILKSTLYRIASVGDLDKELRGEVWQYYHKFKSVDDIDLRTQHFTQVRIHRNNSYYIFLLRLCRMIYEATVLDEVDGQYYFKEFIGSDKAFAKLFESFVRNFYRKEQHEFIVKRDNIKWNVDPIGSSIVDLLPLMQTDISLESLNRKIVIDTKFYRKTVSDYYNTEKFHSGNLYQLYSYVRNLESDVRHPNNPTCEGVLLYPKVDQDFNESYMISGHKIRIVTVDMNKKWSSIHNQLLHIID